MTRIMAAFRDLFLAEQNRWTLWLPVCLGAGIALYFLLGDEPAWWIGPLALAVAAAAVFVFRRRFALQIALWGMVAFAAGFAIAQFRTARVDAPVIEKRIGPVWIAGRIMRIDLRGDGRRLWLDRLSIARLARDKTPERVRIRLRGRRPALSPGDTVRVRAILYPPPGAAAPGAFDFARRAYFERLGAVGFAIGAVRQADNGAAAPSSSPSIAIAALRQGLTRRVLAALPGPSGGIAAALMTGERGAIPPDILAAMRDSGLAHLLAISGLHIGLVGGILFFGIRLLLAAFERTALRHPIKKWAAAAAVVGAFGYLLVSGASVPTQRAFIMLGLVFAAVMLDRLPISMRLVAWAATAVLVIAPESLLSVSFQMSFAAVIALIAVYERVVARAAERTGKRRLPRALIYLGGVLLTTLIAGLATAPFALYHFNRMALYGIVANLVAVPLTGIWIMPWAVAAFALMPFGLERLALGPMGWGIEGVIAVALWVQGLPGSVAVLPAMPPMGLALVALGGLWLCLWRRRWRYLGLAPVTAGMISIALMQPPDILVDGSGRLMAVRGADGTLLLSSKTVERYKAGVWLRRAGETAAKEWPRDGTGSDGRLACDGLGCIYRAAGHTVALVRRQGALLEDCATATVVISRVPVRRRACRGPLAVIDRFSLWREGPHAVWLDAGSVRIESVSRSIGDRPWNRRRNRGRGRR